MLSPPNRHKRFRAAASSGSYFKFETGHIPTRPHVTYGERPPLHVDMRDRDTSESLAHLGGGGGPGDALLLELMASPGVAHLYSSSLVLALMLLALMLLVPQISQSSQVAQIPGLVSMGQIPMGQMPMGQMPMGQMRSYGSLKLATSLSLAPAPFLAPTDLLPPLESSQLRPLDVVAADHMFYAQKPQNVNLYPQQTLFLLYIAPAQFQQYYYNDAPPPDASFMLPQRPVVSLEPVPALAAKTQGYDARVAYNAVHGKNISIASHFDMFSLQERPHEETQQGSNPLALRSQGASETTPTSAKTRADDEEPRDAQLPPLMPFFPLALTYMPPPYYGQNIQQQQTQQPQQQPLQQLQAQELSLQHSQLQSHTLPAQFLRRMPILSHMVQHHSMLPYTPETAALSYFPSIPPPSSRPATSPVAQAHARYPSEMGSYSIPPQAETAHHKKSESTAVAQDNDSLLESREIDALFGARDLLPRAQVMFKLLLADVMEVDAFNFYLFLVRMLLYAVAHIPLDDFYLLLYDESAHPIKNPPKISAEKNKLDKKPADSGTVELMNVFHRILEVFKHPKELINAMPGGDYEKTRLGSVNYHELLRLFLALKIIADVLVISDDREKNCPTTPRQTIYKVYFILCQKLFHKYPAMFGGNSEQKLILGPSKLGKLIKAIYPQIVAKRLGPRGYSKYHYLGLSLSENLVTKEIEALFDMDLAELTKLLSSKDHESPLVVQRLPEQQRSESAPVPDARSFQYRKWTATFMDSASAKRPLYSFIKPKCMFPPTQLSPIYCFDTPLARKDEHSWFCVVRQQAYDELIKLDLDMPSFTRHFEVSAPLETNQDWLMSFVLQTIDKLAQSPHFSKSHYLYLFFYVLVTVFPLMLCLDMTKSDAFLFNLRANVHTLVLNFEEMCLDKPYVSSSHLKSFVGILNKVLNLDDVANSLFKAKRAPAVIDEMFEDIDGLLRTLPGDEGSSVLERLFTNGLVDCLNAYLFVPLMEHGAANDAQVIQLVNSISARLKTAIVLGLRDLVKAVDSIQESFESGLEPKKTRFEYLRLCLGFFYEHCFDDVLVERFTVAIINNYLLLVSNQIMKYIFHTQNQRASMVLNTTFRHWWVVLSFLQEYCGVVLETVGLHHMLGGVSQWDKEV